MKKEYYILFCFFYCVFTYAQQNTINIKSTLDSDKDIIKIQQEITYYNTSEASLNEIYLHNWPNSYRDRKTPLNKRFIEDFKKELYFAKEKNLGYSEIKSLSVNYENSVFSELKNKADIIRVDLKTPLLPKDSLKISATYIVKIPNAKFTGYGEKQKEYHLRFWYLTPAVYKNGWQLMSNLNLDDLYEELTDFTIEINVPKKYILESNLYQKKIVKDSLTSYYLTGQDKTDIILSINKKAKSKSFTTQNIQIYTNVYRENINKTLTESILNRELTFLEKHLGKYPHREIYIDKTTQRKNPIYGLNQLPNFLRPFSDTFKWDITMFKALSEKYIDNTILLNKRKDHWIIDGIQNYLMLEYVEEFYPEIKLLGKLSDKWPIKTFNISKLKFNDKYQFVYQFTSRKFLDQPLRTPLDSLSNFNRRIVNKYKAGLGFKYLKEYLGGTVLDESIKELYQNKKTQSVSTNSFKKILSSKTNKDIDWFFGDYIHTSKKIDYKITASKEEKDSLIVTIKNKRDITTPIALYGISNKSEIKFKQWIKGIDSTKTIKIPKGNFQDLVLNYENLYPEHNTLNNWKSLEKKIFNKPIKLSFYQDISDPNYNQFFYQPNASYNFYNGLILGIKLHNKPLIKRNLEFRLSPSYATKSNSLIGSFAVLYNQYFEKTNIYKISYGVAGNKLDYAPNLSYSSFVPYVNLQFKRKTLRDAGSEFIRAKLLNINKEVAPTTIQTEEDNYSIFSLSYNYFKPDIIKELRYSFSTEFAKNFSKAALDFRYRSLTTSDTQLDFRVYAGAFLKNNTNSDYFSFGLDRPNDYLFELSYFGRSEDSGIFSQQYIMAEGGFKSVLPVRFANQYMVSFNASIGLWRWIEFYNDVAFLKNRNNPIYFAYENGIRFNFVDSIFEIYFPLYSNNGWEVSHNAYPQKIRFTLTGNFSAIFNFFRRGFL